MIYTEGTDIQHIKPLQTRKVAVDNLTTSAMSNETWRGAIIQSIPPMEKWPPVIPSLYSMSSSANIISILFTHGMIVRRDVNIKGGTITNSLNDALAAKTNEVCTNQNCKAKKWSTHTIVNCYWPGGGKEEQFPPNFGQRSQANATTSGSVPSQPEHFVLSAQVLGITGQLRIIVNKSSEHLPMVLISKGFQGFQKEKIPTFMDSGASDTMFVPKEVFMDYKLQ